MDYYSLDIQEVLSLFYTLIIDDGVSMEHSRAEVRDAVDKKLDEIVFTTKARNYAAAKKMAGEGPVNVAKPEPMPFVLTPDMQRQFGLRPPQPKGGTYVVSDPERDQPEQGHAEQGRAGGGERGSAE